MPERVSAPLPANVVVVRSFSKFYGLASLRLGYCIANEEIVRELLARKDVFNVNGLAQAMAVAVLDRHEIFAAVAERLKRGRAKLVSELRRRSFGVHNASGNFVLASHARCSGAHLEHELLVRRVAVRRFPDPLTMDHISYHSTQRRRLAPAHGSDRRDLARNRDEQEQSQQPMTEPGDQGANP